MRPNKREGREINECEWMRAWTAVENPPYSSLSYYNSSSSHCGRIVVVVVGGCGGTNSIVTTPPSSVLSLSSESEWLNENKKCSWLAIICRNGPKGLSYYYYYYYYCAQGPYTQGPHTQGPYIQGPHTQDYWQSP